MNKNQTLTPYLHPAFEQSNFLLQNVVDFVQEHKFCSNWFDTMRYVVQVNSKRRHLTQIQKVALAIREIEKELAKERQKSTMPKKPTQGTLS